MQYFICVNDKTRLNYNDEYLFCPRCNRQYKIINGVIKFLDNVNEFYEGTYESNIKFLPRNESLLNVIPLWLISNNFIWEVRKFIPEGATILELGCSRGVDYLGKRYNMIGADISFSSLESITGNYNYRINIDATKLIPLLDYSVDAVISSYFWEHIKEDDKITILNECKRVLKPGGLLIFLYDVETNNGLLKFLKTKNLGLYNKLFLEGDGHVGYQTPSNNKEIFNRANFQIIKHFGMERTWLQSHSVYKKLSKTTGMLKIISKCGLILNKKPFYYIHLFIVLIFDHTLGRMWSEEKSRIVITIAKNQAS